MRKVHQGSTYSGKDYNRHENQLNHDVLNSSKFRNQHGQIVKTSDFADEAAAYLETI